MERITKQKAQAEEIDELDLASNEPITLSFKDAKLKEVFEFLSKISGISILFDEDVKDQPVTVFAKDVSFKQALNLLLATNKMFMKKIAKDAIIIIPKTKSKLDQYQDLMIRTFYLSHIPAKDMVNILRTMLETRKIIINDGLNSITLRETPDKLKLSREAYRGERPARLRGPHRRFGDVRGQGAGPDKLRDCLAHVGHGYDFAGRPEQFNRGFHHNGLQR